MATTKQLTEKQWEFERRMERHKQCAGSSMFPFSIEPMPYERQRLAAPGMTDEDRELRREWVKDQELAPDEPRYIAALNPKNAFKRFYGKPMNALYAAFEPKIGSFMAIRCRYYIPKFLIIIGIGYVAYYNQKYNPHSWERQGGWHMYRNKQTILEGPPLPDKEKDDFSDKGFKSRKSHHDLKTSFA